MIVLNIDLDEVLEQRLYQRAKEKNLNYLQYVEELIKDDLMTYEDIIEEINKYEEDENLIPPSS